MHLPTLFLRNFSPVFLKACLALLALCLLALCMAGESLAKDVEEKSQAAIQAGEVNAKEKFAEISAGVNARLKKLRPAPAGDFALLEITNIDAREYIFTEFRLHKRVSSPGALNFAKADARAVTGALVEELRSMGIKTGAGGAVAVVRLYDAPKAGEDKNAARLFGTMSCGHEGNSIVWDAVDAN